MKTPCRISYVQTRKWGIAAVIFLIWFTSNSQVKSTAIQTGMTFSASVEGVRFTESDRNILTIIKTGGVWEWVSEKGAQIAVSNCVAQIDITSIRGGHTFVNSDGTSATAPKPEVRCSAVSQDGMKIACRVGLFDEIWLWDRRQATQQHFLPRQGWSVLYMTFSTDGKYLAVVAKDATVEVWDTTTRKLIASLRNLSHSPNNLSFSPSGQQLLVGTQKDELGIWHFIRERQPNWLKQSTPGLSRALWLHDDILVGFGQEQEILICSATDGSVQRRLRSGLSFFSLLCATPKGDMLACAGNAEDASVTVELWDIQRNALVNSVKVAKDGINAMAFSGDGTILAIGGRDGNVYLVTIAHSENGKN